MSSVQQYILGTHNVSVKVVLQFFIYAAFPNVKISLCRGSGKSMLYILWSVKVSFFLVTIFSHFSQVFRILQSHFRTQWSLAKCRGSCSRLQHLVCDVHFVGSNCVHNPACFMQSCCYRLFRCVGPVTTTTSVFPLIGTHSIAYSLLCSHWLKL